MNTASVQSMPVAPHLQRPDYPLNPDATIADVVRDSTPTMERAQTRGVGSMEVLLNHIQENLMANLPHIATYYFLDVFGTWDISALGVNDINMRILSHTHRPRVQRNTGAFIGKLINVDRETLRESLKVDRRLIESELVSKRSLIQSLMNTMRDLEQQMADTQRDINGTFENVRSNEIVIESLQERLKKETSSLDPRRLKLIKSIPSQWIVVDVSTNDFTVVRRTPITITHASISQTLYMGFFFITYDWSLNCLRARPIADLIHVGEGGFHPHLNTNTICWGNQKHRALKMIAEANYEDYWNLLEAILTTYCGDNPYVKFDSLYQLRESSYKAISPYLQQHWHGTDDQANGWAPWFKGDMRNMLLNVWSTTCSDMMLRELPKLMVTGAARRSKRDKALMFAQKFVQDKIRPHRDRLYNFFNRTTHATLGNPRGNYYFTDEWIVACKALKIPIISRNFCLDNDIQFDELPENFRSLLLIWHGSVPNGGTEKGKHVHVYDTRWAISGVIVVESSATTLQFFRCTDENTQRLPRNEMRVQMNGYAVRHLDTTTKTYPMEEEYGRTVQYLCETYPSRTDIRNRHLERLNLMAGYRRNYVPSQPSVGPRPSDASESPSPTPGVTRIVVHDGATPVPFDQVSPVVPVRLEAPEIECSHCGRVDDFNGDCRCNNCGDRINTSRGRTVWRAFHEQRELESEEV